MSEKEKQNASRILITLNKLSEVIGHEYTEGLITGINIGIKTCAEEAKEETRQA